MVSNILHNLRIYYNAIFYSDVIYLPLCATPRDMRSKRCAFSVDAHSDQVTSVNFNLEGVNFVSASIDGVCRIWDRRHTSEVAPPVCLKEVYAPKAPPM